jgi:DNA-binding transcriptional LysR family regulator
MNYTFHQLRIFIRVAETGSISDAAESLHITQPAASQQLKKLQEQFDIPLLETVGRSVHLTEFGRQLLQIAREIEEKMVLLDKKTTLYRGGLSGRLRIAIVSTGEYVMPYFLEGFLKDNPDVELTLDVTNKAGVLRDLEQNEADLALVTVLPSRPKMDELVLMDNHLYLVGNTARVFSPKPYSKELFLDLPLIYREAGSATRFVMEEFFEKKQIRTIKKIELSSNEAVKQAVMAGLGYSIMPLVGLKNELLQRQVQLIPVKGLPVKTAWRLIWHAQKQLPSVALSFLEYLTEHRHHLADRHFSWMSALI